MDWKKRSSQCSRLLYDHRNEETVVPVELHCRPWGMTFANQLSGKNYTYNILRAFNTQH